jgi:hypothetical protein
MRDEIMAVLGTLPMLEAELVAAGMNEILDAAALGQLDDEDVAKVSSDPDMWELRFPIQERIYRVYIAEPASHPNNLIALRFHEKLILPTQTEIDDAQNAEIGRATVRFRAGLALNWGHAA